MAADLGSASTYIDRLRGHIYEPVEPSPVVGAVMGGWGSSDRGPQSLSLRFHVGPERAGIEIEADADGFPSPLLLSHKLLTKTLFEDEPIFPLKLTVDEKTGTLSLDGVRHEATVYACGDRAVASLEIDEISITVGAPLSLFPKLRLVRISHESLARLVEGARDRRLPGQEPEGGTQDT
jgi:hypothetical protein